MASRAAAAIALVMTACHTPVSQPVVRAREIPPPVVDAAPAPALPLDRIAIVGASVSAGFGGAPFGEAFAAAAPTAAVESEANVMLFRDVRRGVHEQLAAALAFRPATIVALDLLFWTAYGGHGGSLVELEAALAELDAARGSSGAWLLVGDIPRVTTAASWMLPPEIIPAADELATANARIAAWASGREHVVLVPFAAWSEPLMAGGEIEITPGGERVSASALLGPDGLHPNAFGVWVLLDRLDHFIESRFPGTSKAALVFARP